MTVTGPAASEPVPAPSRRRADAFRDLGDSEKVKFVESELATNLAHLNKVLEDLDALRAGVEDPQGLVSLTLGFDGRLVDIQIADAIGHVMTNLELEKRINSLLAAGTDGVDAMRQELLDDLSWREPQ
jgi:hypothetical protein